MPVHMPGVQAPPQPMTMDAFMAWVEEDIRAEWVRGEVQVMVAASIPHNRILLFLSWLLKAWLEFRDAGQVLVESFMHLPEIPSLRAPDILVIKKEHLSRLQKTHLQGPADLVVEIVSPDSVARDYVDKVREYARAGVPEYWIVDPGHERVLVLALESEGTYQRVFDGHEGRVESRVLKGFWVRAEWLWQEPLPNTLDAMLEIGGPAFARDWWERMRQKGVAP